MIYFSECKDALVYTEDNVKVGTLEDFIFLASENPIITKMVVRGSLKDRLIIPVKHIKKINHSILIEKNYSTSELVENELHVLRNLLDKQIIDLKGDKVIRVNDVAIQDKGELYISGVDVGLLGILRWLKLEGSINSFLEIFHSQVRSNFLSWGDIQPLELIHGHVKLKRQEEKLKRIKPEDLADYLEKTNVTNAQRFLRILDETKAAQVISHLNFSYQTAFFKNFKVERAAKFIELLDPDDAVDILLTLSIKKRSEVLLNVNEKKKIELERLLIMAKDPVGNLMTTEYAVVSSEYSVRETLDYIKKETSHFGILQHVYVVNKDKQLVGVFNLHELILQDLDTPVYKFMTQNVIVAHLTSPAEMMLKKMLKYKIAGIPVINDDKQIQGIVTLDDVIRFIFNK